MSTTHPSDASPAAPESMESAAPAATGAFRIPGVRLIFRYGIVWAAILAVVVASFISDSFLTKTNLQDALTQNAALALVALGLTFVMIGGAFDLSSGPLVGACTVVAATLANHTSTVVTVLVTIGIGAAAGALNGFLITVCRINAFVATLATGSMFTGAALQYTGAKTVYIDNSSLNGLALNTFLGVRITVLIVIVLYIIGAIILAKSVFGRTLYAVGGNEVSARLAGLRVHLIRFLTFLIVGGACGAGGVIFAARFTSGNSATGSSITLDAITVVIIGGTSLFGGSGAVWRTAVGVVLLATITNVFDLLAINSAWQFITKGALLIAAVGLDYVTTHRQKS